MKQARGIGNHPDFTNGVIYLMIPPYEGYDHIVVSTSSVFGSETYIFGIEKDKSINWLELPGSQKNVTSKNRILEDIGYLVTYR